MKIEDLVSTIVDNRGKNPSNTFDDGLPIIDNSLINNDRYPKMNDIKRFLDYSEAQIFLRNKSKKDDLLITLVGNGYGNITLCPENVCIIQNTIGLRFNELVSQKYMYYKFLTLFNQIRSLNRGASQPSIKVSDLLDLEISIHDSQIQQHIVNTISSLLLKSF